MVLDFKKQFEQKAASVKQSRMEKEKAMLDLQRDIDQAEAAAASANSAEEYAQHKSRADFIAKKLADLRATKTESGYTDQEVKDLYADVKAAWADEAELLYEELTEALETVRPVAEKLQNLVCETTQTIGVLERTAAKRGTMLNPFGTFTFGIPPEVEPIVDGRIAQAIQVNIKYCRGLKK